MSLVDPAVEAYAAAVTTPQPPELARLEAETREQLDAPQMLTGHVEGRLLEQLVFLARPRLVVEIGTYSGYSARSMAAALPEDGRLVTCELSPEHAAFARERIDDPRIEVRVGPALETLRDLPAPWDLVFVDADKTGYPAYVDLALERLAPHGMVVLDNTLRGGSVLDPPADDEAARVMDELNRRLAADSSLVTVLLTVRDGVTLVRRA